MAFPSGVSLATITVGSVIDFFGESTDISVTVTPVLGGDGKAKHIVHADTGHVLLIRSRLVQGSPGGPVSFDVPHVDQPGFVDSAGNAISNWAYSATVVYGKAKDDKWTKVFQPMVGQDLLDLDLIPDGNITAPVSAPLADVTSVNGQTGAVTLLEASPENVEAALPNRLTETELSATIASGVAEGTAGLASKTEVPALYAQTFEPVVESALLNGRAALANWENTPAKWLLVGDSLTYGWNVSQVSKRYASVAARTLRARLGNAPGMEFIAAAVESPSYPSPWTVTGTPAKSGFGPARFAHGLSAGNSQSITVTGKTMNVWFTKSNTGGIFNVTVDGGAPVPVDTIRSSAGFDDGYFTTIDLGTDGQHTIVVSHASGGRAEFTGIEVFTTESKTKGLHVYVAGRPGYKTSDYGAPGGSNYGKAVQTINPNIITYALGVNDYAANVDPEVFGANVRTHLAGFRTWTTSKPSFVLIPVQLRTGTFTYPWQAYVDEMHQIAAEFTDVAVLDMSIRLPDVATDTLALYDDHVHYTDKGAALFGSTLAQFLLPR